MSHAGIAAWLWKSECNLWRPVFGVSVDTVDADPEWNPRGAQLTNFRSPVAPVSERPRSCIGFNFNSSAYPSGQASFDSAAFEVIAKLLGKTPACTQMTLILDEFNGMAIESMNGLARRFITQKISLQDAIDKNRDSCMFIGVGDLSLKEDRLLVSK